jgi:hypothetical protein
MRKLVTRRTGPFWACLLAVGCSAILDIDGHYVDGQKGTGGRGHDSVDASPTETGGAAEGGAGGAETGGTEAETGGAAESGGAPEAGGSVSTAGGAPGSGGAPRKIGESCTATDCEVGLKCCGVEPSKDRTCYAPGPFVGCGKDDNCDRCMNAVPANAVAACVADLCSFVCLSGFTKKGNDCVQSGTGGTGAGGTNTGGAGGSSCSRDVDCARPLTSTPPVHKGCDPLAPFNCCARTGVCGCTFFNIDVGGANGIDIGYCLPR